MERVLFLGNPGTGKSTLLNSLIGWPAFQSGISIGVGLTRLLQEHQARGVTYIDTPGLADAGMRSRAAAEITAALSKHGTYKLFFVITLRSARVQHEDVVTINQVLASVNILSLPYSVIVNSVKPVTLRRIFTDSKAYTAMASILNSGQHSTRSIFFVQHKPELNEQKNAIMRPCPSDFVAFINDAPRVFIAPESVCRVNAAHASFEQKLAQVAREIAHLEQENRSSITTTIGLKRRYLARSM